jgi:hypothetical protein
MGWHLQSRVWTGLELVEQGSASFDGARLGTSRRWLIEPVVAVSARGRDDAIDLWNAPAV